MAHQPIEELDVFALFEEVSTWCWLAVSKWDHFAKRTIGEQLVRAADSINANLVEGDGRYSTNDSIRFLVIARGSARETKLWIARAISRSLVEVDDGKVHLELLERATKLLNMLINYRRNALQEGVVREETFAYPKGPASVRIDCE